MSFVDSFARMHLTHSIGRIGVLLALASVGIVATSQTSWAQAVPPLAPKTQPATSPQNTNNTGPKWLELSASQQQILRPLAGTWNTLSPGHKRKWIALSENFNSKAPAEQEKLQSRMVEWAALKPSDRVQARLNFAQTQKLPAAERSADWEAYQALSPEEKQKLADQAKSKPAGAAVAVKPVPSNRLTPVPVTRNTPQQESVKQSVDRHTLLPKPSGSAAGASSPQN